MGGMCHHVSRIAEPLTESVELSLVRLACQEDVVRMAVMPDVHLSGDVCVGVALATSHVIYPAAVGGDIGCGMLALRFQGGVECLDDEVTAARMLAGLYRRVPALKHATATCVKHLPPELADAALSHPALEKQPTRDARWQLGTLGRGNHFIEFQADELGVIPGSMGTASFHVAGRGDPQSLCSSSHGAGRVLSRTAAAQSVSTSQVRREMREVWFDESRAAEYRDESPAAYRDIRRVMEAQRSLCRIVRALRPVLNFKH